MHDGDLRTDRTGDAPMVTGYATKLRFPGGPWFAVMASSRRQLRAIVRQNLPEHHYRADMVEKFTVTPPQKNRRARPESQRT